MSDKIIDIGKPEDLMPGRMVDRIGTCPHCGQSHYVKAYPDDLESELAELAEAECDCEGAREIQKREAAIASVTDQIRERYRGMERQTMDAVLAALRPVAAGALKKVTLTGGDGSVSYTVFRKEGKLKFLRTYTEQDEVEE